MNTQANAGNHGFHTISKYPNARFIALSEREVRLDARDLTPARQDHHEREDRERDDDDAADGERVPPLHAAPPPRDVTAAAVRSTEPLTVSAVSPGVVELSHAFAQPSWAARRTSHVSVGR